MERKNFEDIIKNSGVNLRKEYDRLFYLFYEEKNSYNNYSVAQIIDFNFRNFWFRGTCLSLSDFDESYGFRFQTIPDNFDLNYLLTFCEYCYNFCVFGADINIVNHINKVLDSIHYMPIKGESGLYIMVEKFPSAISAAEIAPQKLSIETLQYNHHGLQGDLDKKRAILKDMADYIEPLAPDLAGIDNTLKKHLFYLFNNFNIRHNNTAEGSDHNILLDDMKPGALEKVYDDTYQLWLLAILQLDNVERKRRVNDYKIKQDQMKTE